jgi:hypothetical protein
MIRFVQGDVDGVVDSLLPVIRPGFARGGTITVGGWQDLLELPEFVFLAVLSVGEWLGQGFRRESQPDQSEG